MMMMIYGRLCGVRLYINKTRNDYTTFDSVQIILPLQITIIMETNLTFPYNTEYTTWVRDPISLQRGSLPFLALVAPALTASDQHTGFRP